MYKKQIQINQKINEEFFYYNPAYKSLLKKRNSLLKASINRRVSILKPGTQMKSVLSLREFKPIVKYRTHRRRQKFRAVWKILK